MDIAKGCTDRRKRILGRRRLPQKLTLERPRPKIQAKRPSQPRKISPSIRVFSCLRSPRVFSASKYGQNRGRAKVPKALTVAPVALDAALSSSWALSGNQVPQSLTFGQTLLRRAFPNPLTICPGPAHRASRTSSLNIPVGSHLVSRKASPSQPESPAR